MNTESLRPEAGAALDLAGYHRHLAERWVKNWAGRWRKTGRCLRHLSKAQKLESRARRLMGGERG